MHAEVDIYHSNQIPRAQSSRSRHSHRSHRRHRSSRRRHSRSSHRPAASSVVLWSILGAVTAAYVVFLAVTVVRHQRATKPGSEARAASATTDETAVEQLPLTIVASNIEHLVGDWSRSRKTLDVVAALVKEDQLGSAARRLEDLLQDRLRFNAVRMQLAQIYLQQKRFEEAAQLALEVLATDPDRIPARVLLARSMADARRWQAALEAAKWVLADDPYNTEAHDIAAQAYIGLEQPNWALPHLRKLATLMRDDPGIAARLAETYMMLEEYDQAAAILQDLLQSGKPDASAYYHLAVCLIKSGDKQQAADVLAGAARRFGHSFVAAWLHGTEFLEVRDDPLFQDLLEENERESAAPAGDKPTGSPVPDS